MLRALFGHPWPLIGVLHLPPLPGSPRHRLSLPDIGNEVFADAEALLRAGFDGLILENFGDTPFLPDAVEPHTVAVMALLAADVRQLAERVRPERPVAVGVNVLRNDARSAMGIAAMVGASFIRVNVHSGAMVTDQGILQGRAHETLRYRRSLGADVKILADVLVKHASPLGPVDLEAIAKDTFRRGGADALIVSGPGTGEPADLARAARIRRALGEAPLLVGSGLTAEALPEAVRAVDGAIVGTALKRDGVIANPVDPWRAEEIVKTRDAALAARR